VEISYDPDVRPVRAGLRTGGVVLIRPDGHIGFRFPAADTAALAALDRHLSSCLIPDPTVAPFPERVIDFASSKPILPNCGDCYELNAVPPT
jgi:hypothetical protein